MDTHLKIIETLANGVDPATGEVLPNESPYNNPDTIRALFTVIDRIKNPPEKRPKIKKSIELKQSENIGNGLPKNAGLPWTKEQKHKLAEQFKANELLDDLAETHGRTKGAITSELKKQGLIEG